MSNSKKWMFYSMKIKFGIRCHFMKRNTIIDISKKILNKQVLHNQNDLKNCAKDIINY